MTVFEDVKDVSVLPPAKTLLADGNRTAQRRPPAGP